MNEENEKSTNSSGNVPKIPFYLTTWFSVLLFIFAPPLGLVVIWINPRFSKSPRALLTMVVGVWTILWIFLASNSYILMQSEQKTPLHFTAEEIVLAMKDDGMPIGEIIVYTEETDPNKFLGRPNQYTSKARFRDTPTKQSEFSSDPTGGSVEVFETKKLAEERKKYIDGFGAISTEYSYVIDNILLRIDKDILPSQADKYKMSCEEKLSNKGRNEETKTNEQVQPPTPAPEPTPVAVPEPTPAPEPKATIPTEYNSALKKAKSYSDSMHMSKLAIYNQLTSEYGEKFSAEAAQYAINNLAADYNYNALEKAKTYQESMAMSPSAIRDQLTSEYGEQFTQEEADYAIANLPQ